MSNKTILDSQLTKKEYQCYRCKEEDDVIIYFDNFKALYRHNSYKHLKKDCILKDYNEMVLAKTYKDHEVRELKLDKFNDEYAKGFLLGLVFGNGIVDQGVKEASMRF